MQKLRSVNTKFWDDPFISTLTPEEKLLFLYLLTNPLTNVLGIYEITLKRISNDTGLSQAKIETMLVTVFGERGKVHWTNNYIVLPNFLKNQNLNPFMQAGAMKIYDKLPDWLKDSILEQPPKGYQSLRQAILNSNSNSKGNSNGNSNKKNSGSGEKENTPEIKKDKNITLGNFDQFWERFPKKADKGKALDSWKKLCTQKPNDRPSWKMIRSAIYEQKKSGRWQEEEFIPHPATWLNQQRWLDDPKEMKAPYNGAKPNHTKSRIGSRQGNGPGKKYKPNDMEI